MPPLIAVVRASRGLGKCRACGAPMTWYRTVGTGKAMPFEADPPVDHSEALSALGVVDHIDAAYVHFRSCPKASDFRKPRLRQGELYDGRDL